MEQSCEQVQLNEVIDRLLNEGFSKFAKCEFKDENLKYKYEMIKLICEGKEEKECLQMKNILNLIPLNGIIQQRIVTFINNMKYYSLEELILKYDSISSFYYELKKEKIFLDFLNLKKYKVIPFFTMLGFCAYVNLNKDISEEIIKLMTKKYIKNIIEKYINKIRKSLFNIILYYNKIVLHIYDEEKNDNCEKNNCFEKNNNKCNNGFSISNNLLYDEIKKSFERYICFNELFDEGEIVNFVNCLYKAITNDIKSIYLKQGPEYRIINNTINIIFEEILESFYFKYYYQKSNINNLYNYIANAINILSEETLEENYAKFIIKYCRHYKQGNKNIVFSFFSGLNPNNFKETFNKLNFNENCDYYNNIGLYINQISSKKKKMKKESTNQSNDIKKVEEKKEDNIIEESNNFNHDNSQINNNTKDKI